MGIFYKPTNQSLIFATLYMKPHERRFFMEQQLLRYYNYILRACIEKCGNQSDGEDLAQETMLAAIAYARSGRQVENPKAFLFTVMCNKHNQALRKKYKSPVTVNLDTLTDSAAEETESLSDEEYSKIRRRINFLTETTRQVIVRHYYRGDSVEKIAADLGLAVGTVKSRLYEGRNKIKKEYVNMDKQNRIAGNLYISWCGYAGPNNEPMNLVEDNLLAQNILLAAYKKPLSPSEIGEVLGVPTVYIEPVLVRLTAGELMVRTKGNKYYTDFIIYSPEDSMATFDRQLNFVDKHFEHFWQCMKCVIDGVRGMDYYSTLNPRQRTKLERYAVIKALQNFEMYKRGIPSVEYPGRKDGGRWVAQGSYFPAGYSNPRYRETESYVICGHRSNELYDYGGVRHFTLCEFDTHFWDHPARFSLCKYDSYFDGIIKLLWSVYTDTLPDSGISSALIESIPALTESSGLLARDGDKLTVDIPVMSDKSYAELTAVIDSGVDTLEKLMGDEYRVFAKEYRIYLPEHLKSVPETLLYAPNTRYMIMAAVKQAYEKELHLADVDYCCPPVVLVYRK